MEDQLYLDNEESDDDYYRFSYRKISDPVLDFKHSTFIIQFLFFEEWNFSNLVNWTNSYELVLDENPWPKSNDLTATQDANMTNLHIKEWSQFNSHFKEFNKLIESKFANTKFEPVSKSELDIKKEMFCLIRGEKHLQINLMDILKATFIKRIFEKDGSLAKSGYFQSRGDGCPTFSDIYLTTFDSSTNPKTITDVLIGEVKTDKQLEIESDDEFHNKLKDTKSEIYLAVAQIATDLIFSDHSVKIAVLTTYTKTWVFQFSDDQKLLLVSPMIKNENFFQVIYFVYSLLFEKVRNSIFGWSDYVDNNMLKVDEIADNRALISGVDSNDVWQDLLYESISNWKVIRSGNCAVDCHATIRGQEYVVRKCSLTKSDESVLKEFENESKILERLKEIKEVSDFVPPICYYGSFWMQQLLVCDFINGEVYESFDEMDRTTKLVCLERVKQLHAWNILHGDLRAWNFIVQFQPEIKVFVIDFGRSKILDKDAETHEKKKFEESLVEEMKYFKSELKLKKLQKNNHS